jgi:DNA-directed RNA polymerase specialized sigma subunit, sigma24 homolog
VGDSPVGGHDVWMTVERNFDELILPHFNAAYRLARSFTRNAEDAEDIVQERRGGRCGTFGPSPAATLAPGS